MKKTLISLFVIGIITLFTAGAYAEWVLYDNFDSEEINLNKWDIDDSSADISIYDGKAMFVHNGPPGDSSWLSFKKCPETIVGIRVTVTVESTSGDVRARIGGPLGTVGEEYYYVWGSLAIRDKDGDPRIFGCSNVLDQDNNYEWLYDFQYAQFKKPIELTGNTFTITMTYDRNKKKLVYEVDGLGKSIFKLPEKLSGPREYFKGIGTRSNNEEGSCVAYFDDVYVLRKGICDKTKPKVVSSTPADCEKKVSVNLSEISIKFNEAMRGNYSWDTPPPWTEVGTTFQFPKTFIQENISGELLEYNTWYTINVNKGGFYDLAGNPNKPYSFSFKTEKEPE